MQKGLLAGEPGPAIAAVKALDHRARVNGLNAPTNVKVEGKMQLDQQPAAESEDPEESREFGVAMLRVMTDRERRIFDKMWERIKVRARDYLATEKAKPALPQ